jgi:hypothetical protein
MGGKSRWIVNKKNRDEESIASTYQSTKQERGAEGTPTRFMVGVPSAFLLIGLDARMNCSKIKI